METQEEYRKVSKISKKLCFNFFHLQNVLEIIYQTVRK
jgi:hypothetical protein